MFVQYSSVRVKSLLHPVESYNDWKVNRRAPKIGDTGAVVEILRGPEHQVAYVVECVDAGGATEWLAEFTAEELESLET